MGRAEEGKGNLFIFLEGREMRLAGMIRCGRDSLGGSGGGETGQLRAFTCRRLF
jgi:hypothetical protein